LIFKLRRSDIIEICRSYGAGDFLRVWFLQRCRAYGADGSGAEDEGFHFGGDGLAQRGGGGAFAGIRG